MSSSDVDNLDSRAADNNDWQQGRELLRAGQPEAALPFLERAAASVVTADPALYARALSHLGSAQYGAGQFEAAVRTFAQAIALSPGRARLYYDRGNALLASDRLAEARADYERALGLAPDYDEARRALIVVEAEARLGGTGDANEPSRIVRRSGGGAGVPAQTAWPVFEPAEPAPAEEAEKNEAQTTRDDHQSVAGANDVADLFARWQSARAAADAARRELAACEQAERDLINVLLTRLYAAGPRSR